MRTCHLHCPVERSGYHDAHCDRLNRKIPGEIPLAA